MRLHPALTLVLPAAILLPTARAQDLIFTFTPQSSLTLSTDFVIDSEGTLIGNYDETTNPGGTRTRPGLFGGSGNQPIPAAIDLSLAGSDSTRPTGSFRFTADTDAGVFTLESFGADLLGGASLDVPFTLGLLYETFRTLTPNSVYFGGVRLPIPLGQASVSELTFVQTAPVPGVLLPTDTPGVFTFAAVLPVDVTLSASALTQTFDLPASPAALPLTGSLDTTTTPPTITIAWDLAVDQPFPPEVIAQIPPVENQPLALPTLLPPGSVANLLLSLTVTAGNAGLGTTASLVAQGIVRCSTDLNNDGMVDLHDLMAFIEAFEAGTPAADFNADGFADLFDYIDFVEAFESPCNS